MKMYTQSELANELGVPRPTLARWEKTDGFPVVGQRHPVRRKVIYTEKDLALIRKWMAYGASERK